jgi:histidinol-phosphate aminotransferase
MGAKIINVPCEDDLSFDYKEIIKKINQKTKVIYISNPNTPTGSYFSKKEIIDILQKAKNSIVIIDEAYFEYSNFTVTDLINEYDNLIVIRTFSKAFSLASLRLGYCLSCEKNTKEIKKVKELLPESVNKFAQIAGIYALKDIKYMKQNVTSVKKARKFLTKELRKLNLKVYDSTGNFILINFNSNKKAIQIKILLEKKGVFIRDRTNKPKLKGCLRIGLPKYKESKILLKKIKEVLIEVKNEIS